MLNVLWIQQDKVCLSFFIYRKCSLKSLAFLPLSTTAYHAQRFRFIVFTTIYVDYKEPW